MWTIAICFSITVIITIGMGLPGLVADLKKMDDDQVNDLLCFFGFHTWKAWSKPFESMYYKTFGGYSSHMQQKQCIHCNQYRTRRF